MNFCLTLHAFTTLSNFAEIENIEVWKSYITTLRFTALRVYDQSTQDEVEQTIRFHNMLFSKKGKHYEI